MSLCLIKHHAMKTYGGAEVYLHVFLTLVMDRDDWSVPHRGCISLGERASHISRIGWLGPKADLEALEKRKTFALLGTEPGILGRPDHSP
jgi:hypothetical protein